MASTLKILRTIFSARSGNSWNIGTLASVELRPVDGSSEEYFAIRDEVVTKQPNLISTTRALFGQSIVPVVAKSDEDNVLRCIGTGFFISCSGLLITAAHVVTDPIEGKYGGLAEVDDYGWHAQSLDFGVLVAGNPIFAEPAYTFYGFEWISFLAQKCESPLPFAGIDLKLTTDIAICKVMSRENGLAHQPLAIVQPGVSGQGMVEGAELSALGYASMRDITLSSDSNVIAVPTQNFQLYASCGKILERFPENLTRRDVSTPGPCFSCSAIASPGMSGGPVFDHECVYVHGVISKGLKDEAGLANLSYGSMLAPSMGIPIKTLEGATLKDVLSETSHGIPNLSVPGR